MIVNFHHELLLCSSASLLTTCVWLGGPRASSEVEQAHQSPLFRRFTAWLISEVCHRRWKKTKTQIEVDLSGHVLRKEKKDILPIKFKHFRNAPYPMGRRHAV